MDDLERYRNHLRAMLPELSERFGVAELGLFGSRVRGDHRPDSDLDVLVTFHPGRVVGYFQYGALEELLSDRLGLRVDLVHEPALRPEVGRNALAEVQYL